MDSEAVVSNAMSVQGSLRVLQLSLHLFAYLFPKQVQVKEYSQYDFIIVGAGTAGCLLAGRLSENENFNVLLIEDGDDPALEGMLPGLAPYTVRTKYDWNYTTVDDNYSFQCYKDNYATMGRGLGGGSGINYMIYSRGDPNDYRQWAKIAKDSTWDYHNVLPYFKKSEKLQDRTILRSKFKSFHGTDGEMIVVKQRDSGKLKYMEALFEIGYRSVLDTNGNNTLGFNLPLYNIGNNFRQSSCYCFVSPVKNRKNLHVLRNTKVTKIVIKNKRAVGVEIITNGKKMTLKSKLEVILSAGAFNTPQLLMLSGIGPRKHLKSLNIQTLVDLSVGYNLLNHVGVLIAHQTDRFVPTPDFNPFLPQSYINGFVNLNKSHTYPEVQLLLQSSNDARSLLQLLAFNFNLHDDIARKAYEANIEREVLLTYIYNLVPESQGRVMLRSTDPTHAPEIHLKAFSKKADLDLLIRYIKDFLRIERSTFFRIVRAQRIDLAGDRCEGFGEDSDEYWRCYALCLTSPMYHYSGTCAMGTVVDSHLRVKGVSGLRVADASVFPTIPSGNTNAPTMMVAEKAADMIKREHKK